MGAEALEEYIRNPQPFETCGVPVAALRKDLRDRAAQTSGGEMAEKRVSNEQVLTALTDGFDRLIASLTAQAMPVADKADAAPDTTKGGDTEVVEVDDAYLTLMKGKAADHATAQGNEVVLYARLNKAKETKLAYALRERYDTQIAKQPSHIGPVGSFQP